MGKNFLFVAGILILSGCFTAHRIPRQYRIFSSSDEPELQKEKTTPDGMATRTVYQQDTLLVFDSILNIETIAGNNTLNDARGPAAQELAFPVIVDPYACEPGEKLTAKGTQRFKAGPAVDPHPAFSVNELANGIFLLDIIAILCAFLYSLSYSPILLLISLLMLLSAFLFGYDGIKQLRQPNEQDRKSRKKFLISLGIAVAILVYILVSFNLLPVLEYIFL